MKRNETRGVNVMTAGNTQPYGTASARCCFLPCENDADWNLTQITPAAHPADAVTHTCDSHLPEMLEDGVVRYELTRIAVVGAY
jgi:hypothetical protein